VCNNIGGEDCDEMHDKIMSEEMFPDELVKIMIDRSKGTDKQEIVSEIVELMS
jgi:RNA-binding protein YhbY